LNSVNPAGFIRRSGGAAPIFVKSGHAHRVGGDPYGLVPAAFLRQQQTGAPEPNRGIGYDYCRQPDRSPPVRGMLSTLATVWRIASPYFSSEDRWAGRILLAAVVAI